MGLSLKGVVGAVGRVAGAALSLTPAGRVASAVTQIVAPAREVRQGSPAFGGNLLANVANQSGLPVQSVQQITRQAVAQSGAPAQAVLQAMTPVASRVAVQAPLPVSRDSVGMQLFEGGPSFSRVTSSGGQQGQTQMARAMCPIPGQTLNRSTYTVRGGGTSRYGPRMGTPQVIERGTQCVTRRHINPANGRAAATALRRLAAFDKLASRVDRQLRKIAHTKRGGRGRAVRTAPCGCGGRHG